ncbi:hypothetical protein OJ998_22835 [Solirubrobacter taibaiensis]|nr:hypothetical protein [Solirubrobacter taibaiensis]
MLETIALSLAFAMPAEIAFTSDTGIFSLKADGSGRAPLVLAPRGEVVSGAAWSPDGTRLVYDQGDEDTSRLMLKDATGTRELTTRRAGVSDLGAVWSPDGSTLLFTRFTLTETTITTQIVTREIATGAERVLVTQDAGNRLASVNAPTYSPDGATIAFTYGRYDRDVYFLPEIRTMPAAGGPAKTLIRRAQGPSYSPDGTRIAYGSIADHNGDSCGSDQCSWAAELYVANADGTGPRRLTKDEGGLGVPRWSADGSRILFASDRNLPDANSTELYSVAPDGSCLTWLTNGVPSSGDPAWRPGSGDSFSANCDPKARPATYTPPKPNRYRANLWLGAKYKGLLLTHVSRESLWYSDCERFSGCPDDVSLTANNPCQRRHSSQYKLSVRRGMLVADYGGDTGPLFFGGRMATLAPPGVTDLKVFRRETPRIPRTFLAALTATQRAKLKPYRVC